MPAFYTLLLAHLVADFLQPAWLVSWAKQSTYALLVHVGAYSLLSGLILYGYGPRWPLLLAALAATHFCLDHVKFLLARRRNVNGLHVLLIDQALHIGVIAVVAFAGLRAAAPSPFLAAIAPYWATLPLITAYCVVTFAVSIVVFEAGRTFAPGPTDSPRADVATSAYRLPGMLERAAALTLILVHLYVVAPLAFAYSIWRLAKERHGGSRTREAVELAVSAVSTVAAGIALLL